MCLHKSIFRIELKKLEVTRTQGEGLGTSYVEQAVCSPACVPRAAPQVCIGKYVLLKTSTISVASVCHETS